MVKEILENAIYHLRFERKNLNYDITREHAAIICSQDQVDKKLQRLTQIHSEIKEILAAAESFIF